MKRVLLTGAAGLIGGVLGRALEGKCLLRSLDFWTLSGIDSVAADITMLDLIEAAFHEVDTVVHLAAEPREEAPWHSVLSKNIEGTYNVFEAAKRAGVGRVILAGSNLATGMYERDMPYSALVSGQYERVGESSIPYITHDFPVRPDGYYSVSKVFGETLGRYYSDEFGMSVICLRIGTVNKADRPLDVRDRATWLSHRDLARLVERCISVQGVKFDIFYGVSNNKWRFWDIEHAREVLGYEPVDDGSVHGDA